MLSRLRMMGATGIRSGGMALRGRIDQFTFVALRSNLIYGIDIVNIRRDFSNKTENDVKKLKISWKDLKNLVDLPENRSQGLKCRLVGIKDQVVKLGGVRVLVFYFGSMFVIWGGIYFLMRYSWLEMDTLIDLMSRYEITSRGISLVETYPELSYLILSYLATNCFDPIRTFVTLVYARYVLRKNYLNVALSNLDVENEEAKSAAKKVKVRDVSAEEEENPKLKASRIITIKGKNNSSVSI